MNAVAAANEQAELVQHNGMTAEEFHVERVESARVLSAEKAQTRIAEYSKSAEAAFIERYLEAEHLGSDSDVAKLKAEAAQNNYNL